jgi:hypothetical protein
MVDENTSPSSKLTEQTLGRLPSQQVNCGRGVDRRDTQPHSRRAALHPRLQGHARDRHV